MKKIITLILALSMLASGFAHARVFQSVNNLNVRVGDLGTPINMDAVESVYPISGEAWEKLSQNGFVVLKATEDYISDCYWQLFGRHEVSVFITSDALLHIFHVVHDNMLKTIEKEHLTNFVKDLVVSLQEKSIVRYEEIDSNLSHVKEAARRNIIFFSVALKLLEVDCSVPGVVKEEVEEYVEKILNHTVTEFYPGDDYTQYEPRGHYEGDVLLERYFRCMKWISRRIFRIEDSAYPEDSHIEIIQAVMISQMLEESPDDYSLWDKIYRVTRLLVGTADSIIPGMVFDAVENVFGADFDITMLEDAQNIEKLREEFSKPEYPKSEIIPVPLEYPGQISEKYIQFMGERYIPDGYAFQQLTFPHVPKRLLPKGLDVMACVLNSQRAEQLLSEDKEAYLFFDSQLAMLQEEFQNYTQEDWTKTVYNNWLYVLKPLLSDFGESYPLFMQNTAWQDEKLNTTLSSWTQLRHDYILYAKPTYIPAPVSMGYGYVEPIPEFYHLLAALCRKIDSELTAEKVLPQNYKNAMTSLARKLDTFEKYATKIVNNEPLTKEEWGGGEQDDIHGFGLWLLGFFSEYGGIEEEKPTLVADVATDSNTYKVLHEGVGKFNPIIIIYQQPDGTTLAGIGFAMSYYEFTRDNFDRISDSEWEQWVDEGNLPPRPSWTDSFGEWQSCVCPKVGDVSGDGIISAFDAVLILQYVVGLRDSFPADMLTSPDETSPRDYVLSLTELTANAGDRIQTPILIDDAAGLMAGGLSLKYDPTILKAIDVAVYGILSKAYWQGNTDLEGEVRFAFASAKGATGSGRMLVVEFDVLPDAEGKTSHLILDNVNLSGSLTITKINGSVTVLPTKTALLPNYPNPFNPETWIPYKLTQPAHVVIRIYNQKGQVVHTLSLGTKKAGVYLTKGKAAYWDGRNQKGEKVASGVYFYTLRARDFSATRRMLIVK